MKTMELVKGLETFLRDLKEHAKLYKEFLLRLDQGKKQKLDDQEEQLSRQFGRLGPFIARLNTIQFIDEGITVNPWTSAFVDDFPARKQQSLRMLVRELSRIIGHYESIDKESILLEDTNMLFDALKLHPRIVRVSKTTFEDGHYAEAIRNAFKEVIVTAREVSGLRDLDGKKLMDQAFSVTNPKIKLNNLV
ncbi:MAG: TIGR02391 family protein, partial [Candidatus Binatia bacterium]